MPNAVFIFLRPILGYSTHWGISMESIILTRAVSLIQARECRPWPKAEGYARPVNHALPVSALIGSILNPRTTIM